MASESLSIRASASQGKERLDFETLIADTSAWLIASSFEDLDGVIDLTLERIRTFFRAERCALLQVSDDGGAVHVAYASYADGVARVSGDVNLVTYYPWSARKLLVEHEPVIVPRMADLPAGAALDRASWERLGTRSNLTVPIVVGAVVRQMIVIHSAFEERDWSHGYVPRLRLLGEVLVNTLERKQAFQALRASEREAREQSVRVAAAVDAAELGFLEWHIGCGKPFLDPRMRELLGVGGDDGQDIYKAWFSRVDVNDLESLQQHRQRLLAGEIDRFALEYRYEHPQRGWIWLRHTTRRLEDDPQRRGEYLVTAILDITAHRQREEDLRSALEQVERLRQQCQRENVYLRQESRERFAAQVVIGRSPAILRALALAEEVAATNSTVLLVGETGTGKERFATLIHEASPRRGRAMIRVNCPAIPDALIESELFGREKGAYTGALSRQIGRFEMASGSTLFLDEISDLPLEMQVKLLRVLQERTIERLGSPRPIPVDLRIIAATNRDLEQAIHDGAFRSDLYYRLNVFPIVVPPLRERLEDIPLLVEAFVDELGPSMGKRFESVERTSLDAMQRYAWPGNIRELRNVIERAMIRSAGPTLRIEVPAPTPVTASTSGAPPPAPPSPDLHEVEREHILRVLRDTGWRIRGPAGAAEVLGLKPTTLEARMAKLGIHRPSHEKESLSQH